MVSKQQHHIHQSLMWTLSGVSSFGHLGLVTAQSTRDTVNLGIDSLNPHLLFSLFVTFVLYFSFCRSLCAMRFGYNTL